MAVLKTEKMILIGGVVLCFVVSEPTMCDMTFMPRWLLWSGIALILAVMLAFKKSLKVPKNLIIPAFLLYLVMAVMSLLKAYNVSEGIFEVCKIGLMFGSLIVVSSIVKNIKEIAKPFVLLALALGLYGLWYIYNVWEGQGANFATMGSKNIWSQANFLLLPFCLYVAFWKTKLWWRIIGIAASLLVIANIIIPQTRAAILALVVSTGTVLLFQKRILIFCGLILLIMVGVGVSFKLDYLTGKESIRTRICTWKQTLKLIKDKFMVGAGNWQLEIPLYARGFWSKKAYQNLYIVRPHNDYLWVTSELSPIGLVFYLLLFALSVFYARHNPYILMGLVGYMVIAFFSFPKERASLSIVLIFFMALAIGNSPRMSLNRVAVNSMIIIAVAFVIFNFAIRTKSERLSRKILTAFSYRNWSEVIKLTDGFPPKYINPMGVPVYYYRGAAFEMSGDYNNALIAYLQARKAHTNHIYVLSGVGVCYYKFGMYNESAECYQRALFIRPNFEGARRNLKEVRKKLL